MTCVAVSIKHGCIASDSRCSTDNAMFSVNKVRQVGQGLVGAAGAWSDVLRFWDFLDKKKATKDGGALLHDNSELEAIELHPEGIFLYEPNGARYHIKDGFYAVGSGGPYALGAMAMGASPEEAVAIAARFDPNTGGEVEVLKLKVANAAKTVRRRVRRSME